MQKNNCNQKHKYPKGKKKNEIGEISRVSLLPSSEIPQNHKNRFKSCKRQNHRGFKSGIWSETAG